LGKDSIRPLEVDAQVIAENERTESAFERTSAQLQVLLAVAMQLGGLGVDIIEMSPGHPGLPFNKFSLHISSYRSSQASRQKRRIISRGQIFAQSG
jgi:hypothetical protein